MVLTMAHGWVVEWALMLVKEGAATSAEQWGRLKEGGLAMRWVMVKARESGMQLAEMWVEGWVQRWGVVVEAQKEKRWATVLVCESAFAMEAVSGEERELPTAFQCTSSSTRKLPPRLHLHPPPRSNTYQDRQCHTLTQSKKKHSSH